MRAPGYRIPSAFVCIFIVGNLYAPIGPAAWAAGSEGGGAVLRRIDEPRDHQAEARSEDASQHPAAARLWTGTGSSESPGLGRIELPFRESTTQYHIRLDLSEDAVEQARSLGLSEPRPGEKNYDVSEKVLESLRAAGLEPVVLGGVTTHRFVPALAGPPAAEPPGAEGSSPDPEVISATGSFLLSSGTVNDYIPDPGYLWRWIQVGGGGGAPAGSITTGLLYRLRIHNDSSPTSIYCGDYEVYLSSTAHGGAQPYALVYDNLGTRTDGGYDDDAENDYDIYLNWRGTQVFNGEDPNQQWYVYIRDTFSADYGYLQYIEFQVSWESPTFDLQATDVYLRTQTGDAGTRVDSPQAGQALYPHFTYTLSGNASLNGTIWRIRLDDATTLCSFTGTITPGTYVGWCNSPWTVTSGLHNLNGRADPNSGFAETNENNNDANRNYSVSQPLDLQAQDVYLRTQTGDGGTRIDSPQPGQSLYPHFTYTINGPGSITGTIWRIRLDNTTTLCSFSGTLSPGSYVGWCNSPWTVTSGAHTLNGRVDPDGSFAESSEGNNDANRNYSSSGTPDIRIEPLTLSFSSSSLQAASAGMADGGRLSAAGSPNPARVAELMSRANSEGSVRVIVHLRTGFTPEGHLATARSVESQRNAIGAAQDSVLRGLAGQDARLVARFRYIPFLALEVSPEGLAALVRLPEVAGIEEDVAVPPVLASSVPVIRANQAWAAGYTGSGQVVAILDTGVDKTHPFFTTGHNKVVSEACYSTTSTGSTSVCPGGASESTASGSGVPCTASGCNHGTHVAGIAAGDNGTGPNIGVARGADLIAIQVFSQFSSSSTCSPLPAPCPLSYTSDQIRGLERVYALRTSFNIAAANLSLGGGRYFSHCDDSNTAQKAAIDNLRSAGIATVIAAGNNSYTDSISSPACISTAVSVGATNDSDDIASFSNIASIVDLLAPGVSIDSSVPGGGTATFNGTSMATPHVAGAWAILKQANPGASVDTILQKLRTTGVLVDDLRSGGTIQDMPRIDLAAALQGSGPGQFTIYNDGNATLTITSIQVQPAASWITWSPQAPFDIAPGASRVVNVSVDFGPAPAGQSTYRLLVSSNDPDESPYPNGVFVVVNKSGGSSGLNFYTVTPCRVFDTRNSTPLFSGAARIFPIASSCNIPLTAKAISGNVTVVSPTGQGYITLYPGTGTLPLASTINFRTGQVRANNAVLQLGTDGSLGAFASVTGNGQAHLILDVNGYFQ